MIGLAWLSAALPLAAFLSICLATRAKPRVSGWIATVSVALSWVIALAVLADVQTGARSAWSIHWLTLGQGRGLDLGFRVDPLTAVMLVIVTTVGLLVHLYSQGYMVDVGTEHAPGAPQLDPGYARYFAILALFTAAMLGLVLAGDLLTLYIFWELVGLCSYLLIGHWYHRPAAAAAKKAFIVTRVGDVGLLVGLLLWWAWTGTLDFTELARVVGDGQLPPSVVATGALLIFAGAAGKSAQFPLHVWLPDAMEGPTPVSALIHAATMVAAGVYLVARTFPIFEHSQQALLVVAAIGAFTAIFAATMALVQLRMKRVIAYSTISQLGYMMLAMGVSAPAAGMFHLWTNAFFKALLFLAAGSVMYALHRVLADGLDPEDLRNMGGLRRHLPVTTWSMLIGALALAGVFPLAGFWSKDEIVAEVAASSARLAPAGLGWVAYPLLASALITIFLTAFYSFRLVFLAFFGSFRGDVRALELGLARQPGREDPPTEPPLVMTLPLVVLAALSVVAGLWGTPLAPAFQAFITPADAPRSGFDPLLAMVSQTLALLGILLAYLMYVRGSPSPIGVAARAGALYRALLHGYYVDEAYRRLVALLALGGAAAINRFDRAIVDGLVNGVARFMIASSGRLRTIQNGNLHTYALVLFAGVTIIAVLAVLVR